MHEWMHDDRGWELIFQEIIPLSLDDAWEFHWNQIDTMTQQLHIGRNPTVWQREQTSHLACWVPSIHGL
jgi:hypothetical protein